MSSERTLLDVFEDAAWIVISLVFALVVGVVCFVWVAPQLLDDSFSGAGRLAFGAVAFVMAFVGCMAPRKSGIALLALAVLRFIVPQEYFTPFATHWLSLGVGAMTSVALPFCFYIWHVVRGNHTPLTHSTLTES
jgi:hypothetical protein